ncbi:hypothetical protein [Gordonia hydrophobica]|uniref:DUF2336 domain-containing protein n=1 Tax=Gordonia hydrophobica TaxID=40516 RepID=A0ABZ2TZQ8_9ACTN|nr:hypothetical protein [Gordonia hydrophobica]MBM7366327.1 hypothetical protein [Gordonia hydrophobica]
MPTDSADLAARLLEAHIDFERRRLTDPAAFNALVQEEIDAFLAVADDLPLEVAVSRDLVKAVARKYTVAFPVEGAIPELVGTVAARLYAYSVAHDTTLPDVLDRRRFEELATGVADLGLSRRVVQRVLSSPATEDACVEAVQRAVDSSRLPERAAKVVDTVVEHIARRGAQRVLAANRVEADHLVLDAAREVWLAGADQPVRAVLSDADVEDTVVLAFEFWRSFRETTFFQGLLDEGVDEVFNAYGDTPLAELLDELGLGREDLVEEAMRFGPPVLEQLDADGVIEQALRRRLEPFYRSADFAATVGESALRERSNGDR